VLAVSPEDYLWFVDQALDAMVRIVGELGDDGAHRRPALSGANSPYAILTHCLGVMEFWGGHVVAGRRVRRDRDAEFRAEGPVADLVARAARARGQLEDDLSTLDTWAVPRGGLDPEDAALPLGRSQGGALLHVLEELTQHLGQMELSRDLVVAPSTDP
jgi:hypothetical protein